MAIFVSQEILQLCLRLLSAARSQLYTPRTWPAFLLNLDFAIEFPMLYASVPSISQTVPDRAISSPAPELSSTIFQIVALLVIENMFLVLLPMLGLSRTRERELAAAISLCSEFLAPRMTMLFGIPLLESIFILGKIKLGQVHFVGVVGWLLCRQAFARRRI
jgi:hypothetical protein